MHLISSAGVRYLLRCKSSIRPIKFLRHMLMIIFEDFCTKVIFNFQTDRFLQTVQTKIRLWQSDQGLHCLLFQLNHLGVSHHGRTMECRDQEDPQFPVLVRFRIRQTDLFREKRKKIGPKINLFTVST